MKDPVLGFNLLTIKQKFKMSDMSPTLSSLPPFLSDYVDSDRKGIALSRQKGQVFHGRWEVNKEYIFFVLCIIEETSSIVFGPDHTAMRVRVLELGSLLSSL